MLDKVVYDADGNMIHLDAPAETTQVSAETDLPGSEETSDTKKTSGTSETSETSDTKETSEKPDTSETPAAQQAPDTPEGSAESLTEPDMDTTTEP